jgi:hypothetical protein
VESAESCQWALLSTSCGRRAASLSTAAPRRLIYPPFSFLLFPLYRPCLTGPRAFGHDAVIPGSFSDLGLSLGPWSCACVRTERAPVLLFRSHACKPPRADALCSASIFRFGLDLWGGDMYITSPLSRASERRRTRGRHGDVVCVCGDACAGCVQLQASVALRSGWRIALWMGR